MDIRGLGYLVLDERRGGKAPQYWLTVRLKPGWMAAYRITYHGDGSQRRARIRELRVVPVPGLGAEFLPSYPYERLEAKLETAGKAMAPFSFESIRRYLTARRFADALAAVGSLIPDEETPDEWGSPATQLEKHQRQSVGRPALPLSFYAAFAMRYHSVEHAPRREPGTSTRAELARKYDVPVSTIGKWIRTARLKKLLTPAIPGRRGGMATDLAKQFSKKGTK